MPERSDINIHLELRTAEDERPFDELAFALDMAARVERAYGARVPNPLHTPKPQLTFVSALHALADYVPSPPETVTTLFGESSPTIDLDDAARATQRARDRDNLRANAPFVGALPRRAVDRPGALVARLVDELSWRVSAVAPRVLSLRGGGYEDVWSMNRSALVRQLEAIGQRALADAYVRYYLAGWRIFRASREGDRTEIGAALRDALTSGAETLQLGLTAAQAAARST